MWEPRPLTPLWAFTACYRDSFTYFFFYFITGDETWVYGYDIETKQQSSHWKSPAWPHPKKTQKVHLWVIEMLLVFFDHRDIVHYEFAQEVIQTIKEFISEFWDICRMQYKECELREAGSSIIIMRLLTHHCQLDNFWQNIKFLPFHNAPIHLTFFYSLMSELPLKNHH
jgi:hypothetical protein